MSEGLECLDYGAGAAPRGDEIQRMYQGSLDAVVLRGALPGPAVRAAAAAVVRDDAMEQWNRPNRPMPPIDLRLLGIGAAPCATLPTGPEVEPYLAAVAETEQSVRDLFADLDPYAALQQQFTRLSGLPAVPPVTAEGRSFCPGTVRAMPAGAGLLLHHDNHYHLPVYGPVREQLDTGTLLSFFAILRRPAKGGRLCVFNRGPQDDAHLPHLDNGFPDPQGFLREVYHQYFDLGEGDLIVFASSRLYHMVEPVAGPDPRITLGGFMGLDRAGERCLYWS